jgi:hypothetical protein
MEGVDEGWSEGIEGKNNKERLRRRRVGDRAQRQSDMEGVRIKKDGVERIK